jgi:hypothetical protein
MKIKNLNRTMNQGVKDCSYMYLVVNSTIFPWWIDRAAVLAL